MASTLGPAPPADLEVLAPWAPEIADTFVALSCDVALVIDLQGHIVRLAQNPAQPIAPSSWLGTRWALTTTVESRPKVEQMLIEVSRDGHTARREITHPDAIGGPVPVAYTAVRLGELGPTLAVGHDLRQQAALQERYLAAQQALERSYWNAGPRRALPMRPGLMSDSERASLGLPPPPAPDGPAATSAAAPAPQTAALAAHAADLTDSELVRALGRLLERLGEDTLPVLLRDARRLAERHFLARAAQRAGGLDALARALGVSRRSLSRRRGGRSSASLDGTPRPRR